MTAFSFARKNTWWFRMQRARRQGPTSNILNASPLERKLAGQNSLYCLLMCRRFRSILPILEDVGIGGLTNASIAGHQHKRRSALTMDSTRKET
jgi:hypothetical protein